MLFSSTTENALFNEIAGLESTSSNIREAKSGSPPFALKYTTDGGLFIENLNINSP